MAHEQSNQSMLGRFSSVRTQLLVVTILLALVPLTVFEIVLLMSERNEAIASVDANLEQLASIEVDEISATLTNQLDLLTILAEDSTLKFELLLSNASYDGNETEINQELTALQEEWQSAGDEVTPLVRQTLNSIASNVLNRFSEAFPAHPEIFIMDNRGRIIGTTNQVTNLVQLPSIAAGDTSTYYNLAWQGGQAQTYVAPEIVFDNSVGADTLRLAVPVFDNGQAIGLIVTNWVSEGLIGPLERVSGTQGETAIIVNSTGELVLQPRDPIASFNLDTGFLAADRALQSVQSTSGEAFFMRTDPLVTSPESRLESLNWYVVMLQSEQVALSTFNAVLQRAIVISVGILLIALAIAFWMTRRVTSPLIQLQNAAEQIGRDRQWNTRVEMERRDEFGVLGNAFNTMASELESIVSELEGRVEARTADLETSADIAAAANAARESDELTTLAVNLIRDRFDFYYTQIYLLDPTQEFAVLADGTGYVGRRLVTQGHRLNLSEPSLVAKAIETERSVIVDDTRENANFRPNELLPETRSELVIPLRLSNEVIGVLDIQHDEPNAFSDDSRRLFQTLADQLAVTFDNARLLRRAEERAREMATVAEVSIQSTANLDVQQLLRTVSKLTRDNFGLYHTQIFLLNDDETILRMAAGAGEAGLLMMEQGHQIELSEERSIVAQAARALEPVIVNDVQGAPNFKPNEMLPHTASELAVPMVVGETLIGILDVQDDQANAFDDDDVQVLTTLGAQVAVAVQNARIFTETENAQLLLETIINGSPDWIFAKDRHFRYMFVNEFLAQSMGVTPAEMIGKTDMEVGFGAATVMGDEAQSTRGFRVDDTEVLVKGEPVHIPLEFATTADGSEIALETTKLPLRDNEGEVIGVLGISRDITERHRNEQIRQIELEIVNRLNGAQSPQGVVESLLPYAQEAGVLTVWLMGMKLDENNNPTVAEVVSTWGDTLIQPGVTFDLAEYEIVEMWLQDPFAALMHENVNTDKRLDEATRQVYQSMEIEAATILPMNLQGKWVGLMLIGWAEEYNYTELDRRVFNTLIFQGTPVYGSIRNVEQITRRAAELATVAEVGTAASAFLDVETLLKRVSDLTKERFDHYHSHIYLYDEEKALMRLAAGAGDAGDAMVAANHSINYHSQSSLVAQAARTAEVVISNDVMWEDAYLPNPLLPDTRSELAVPMLASGRLIGVLDVQSAFNNRFTQEDATVLSTLANQVAVAVDNARLFQETERRVTEMEALTQITTETTSLLDIDDLLWAVADLTQRDFHRYHVQIYLKDEREKYLELVAASGDIGRDIVASGYAIALNMDTIATRAAKTQKPVVVGDIQSTPDYLPNPYLPDVLSVLAIPIIYANEMLGVLEILDDQIDPFGEPEIQTKQTLANQVAVAIKNAQQYQLTQQRLREVVANVRIGEALRMEGSLDKTLENVLEIVRDTLNPDNIVMMNYDYDNDYWIGDVGVGDGMTSDIAKTLRVPANQSPHGLEALRDRKVVAVDNLVAYLMNSGLEPDYLEDLGILSVMAIPVAVGRETRGAVYLNYNHALHRFTEDERRLARSIANQLSLAIERRENEEERRSREEEQALLLVASQKLNSAQAPQAVLDVFRDYVVEQGAFSGNLFYVDVAEDGSAEWATSVAGWQEGSEEWLVPEGTRFYIPDLSFSQLWLGDPNNATLIEDMQSDKRVDENTLQIYQSLGIQGAALIPLYYQRRWVGVITLNWREPMTFTERDGRILRQLMRQSTAQIDAIRVSDANLLAREEAELIASVNSALSQATNEKEILSAMEPVALVLSSTQMQLGYVDSDEYGNPEILRNQVIWENGEIVPEHPFIGVPFPLADFGTAPYWIEAPNDVFIIENAFEDERVDPTTAQAMKDLNTQANVVLPLYAGGRWHGVMLFQWSEPRSVTERERQLMVSLRRTLSSVVSSRRAYLATQEANSFSETLATITGMLSQASNTDEILEAVAAYARAFNPALMQLTYIQTDPSGRPVSLLTKSSWEGGALNPESEYIGSVIDLTVIPTANIWIENPDEPMFMEDASTDPRLTETDRQIVAQYGVMATISIPLRAAGDWQGVVTISWAEPHTVTPFERGIYTQLSRPLSAVVASQRSYEATQEAQYEADALFQISARINESESEADLLAAVIEKSIVPQATSIALGIFDNDRPDQAHFLHIVADWTNERPSLEGLSIPLEQLKYYTELGSDDVSLVANVHEDERLSDDSRATLEALGVEGMIMLPLTLAKRWLGVISFYTDDPTDFSAQQQRMLRSVGRQLTAAIERLNLLRQAEERAAELETVAQLSAATTTILDPDELLASVVELTKSSFGLYHAHVYLLDEDQERLVLASGAGEPGRLMKGRGHNIPLNHPSSLVARCARERTGIVANDVHESMGFLPNPLLPDTRSELAVPMIVGGELVGVLDAQSDEVNHFDEDDVRLKTTLADQIAVAVQNALAFERERRAADYYREADRLKQEFLANMSHELRTPLNSIIGYSEVLLDGVDGELTEDAVEDVEAIYNSGRHLLNIINEILDLAKIEAGQMQLHIKQMDLEEALQHVVKSSQILVKEKPVDLQLVKESEITEVLGDQVRINQIMLNLVSNAIKFTEEGTINVRYGLADDNTIRVSVQDSGVGMTEENLKVIFDRFRQVDGSSTRRAGGTGLGLTITRQLIQMHGGDINVDSEEGIGSTFWFTIPVLEMAQKMHANGALDQRDRTPQQPQNDQPVPEAGD